MTYPEQLGHLLRPCDTLAPLVVDLFSGCGGLALGFEAAGFETHGFEMNKAAFATYQKNLQGTGTQTKLTPDTDLPSAMVLIGAPPCQPFSVFGKQAGLGDARDGFPIFISAVARLRPEVFLFENVRGMLYQNRWYLDQVLDALRGLGYMVEAKLLNANDFGVPQNRERLIVVGHHGSGEIVFGHHGVAEWEWPEPITCARITAGEALGDLTNFVPIESKVLTTSMDSYIQKYEAKSKCTTPRDLHLDRPARTLTCRNLAGATGDMQRIRLPDGRRRRLVVREAARLQSFPDWFDFCGTETEQFNQIGNAVAPLFAFHLANAVRKYLDKKSGVA